MKNRILASIDLDLLGDEYKCLRCGNVFFWNLGGCSCGETKEFIPADSISTLADSLTEEDWILIAKRNREFFKNDFVRVENLEVPEKDSPALFSAEKIKKFLKDE